jgi:hypothetical protein
MRGDARTQDRQDGDRTRTGFAHLLNGKVIVDVAREDDHNRVLTIYRGISGRRQAVQDLDRVRSP